MSTTTKSLDHGEGRGRGAVKKALLLAMERLSIVEIAQTDRTDYGRALGELVGALATGAVRPLRVPMPAITKVKKAAARPARSTVKKTVPARIPGLLPVRTPPPAKFTAADLLKMKDFGKGADWDVISLAYESRNASRR